MRNRLRINLRILVTNQFASQCISTSTFSNFVKLDVRFCCRLAVCRQVLKKYFIKILVECLFQTDVLKLPFLGILLNASLKNLCITFGRFISHSVILS